jgi:integrase
MSLDEITATTPVKKLSNKTINEYLTVASSVIDWGKRQGYISYENYFAGMKLKSSGVARDAVHPFTDAELQRIFDYPEKILHPYRYWIPIIALYSGMRMEEIAHLYVHDVKQEGEVWLVSVDNDRPDKNIKNDNSKRTVPIHSELLRLGLLEFVEQQRTAGEERLFPELITIGGRYGKTVSSWFSERKKKLGFGRTKNFHSFRHTFTNALKQNGVVEGITAELIGHATEGISYSRYAERYSLDSLATTVNSVSFDTGVRPFTAHKFTARRRKISGRAT